MLMLFSATQKLENAHKKRKSKQQISGKKLIPTTLKFEHKNNIFFNYITYSFSFKPPPPYKEVTDREDI